MKRFTFVIIVLVALAAGGAIGWAVRGTQAGAPASTTATNTSTDNQTTNTTSDGRCSAKTLTAKVAPANGGAAAGNRYYDITVTNSSTSACTISGYPGLSLTDSTGATVGQPAEKDQADQAGTVSLAVNESAKVTFHLAVSDNFPDGTCKEGATTIKIYPPNDTGYLTVPSDTITTWCPGFSTTGFVKA